MPYNLRGPLEIVITEQNYRDYTPGGSAATGVRHGLIPRNYSLNPVGSYPWATAVDFPLIDKAEWADRLAKMEADKSRLSDLRLIGNSGQMIPSRDQNGKGYCWAHSGVSAHLLVRAVMGQPFADLSAYSIACPIKQFADEGGWGAQGVDYQIANGCATSKTWPQQSMSRSNVNDAMKADAAKHKMLAQWADLSAGQYDRNLTFAQVATLLLNCSPVVVDYNWWSHSVCAADLVKGSGDDLRNASGKLLREYDPATFEFIHDATGYGDSLFGVRIWNSWGDTWSQQGMGVLDPSKAVPNGAVGAKLVMASGG